MLEVRDLHVNYGASQILHGVSVEVRPGEIVAVIGRNGVGKSTLMRAIMGLTPPRSGEIRFKAQRIDRLPPHRIARLGLGYVPQGRRIFPSLDVKEHLSVTARATGGADAWTRERICAMFPNLAARLHQPGGKLSGGEQEMLAMGRALVANPDLMLMDEPTEGLAPLMVRELGRLVGALKERGTPVLLVEQQLAFVLRYADRVYILAKGQVVHQCAAADLAGDKAVLSRYLGV